MSEALDYSKALDHCLSQWEGELEHLLRKVAAIRKDLATVRSHSALISNLQQDHFKAMARVNFGAMILSAHKSDLKYEREQSE